jgi:mannose-6-phosphate isomerase-like protein (cupin superfamily)
MVHSFPQNCGKYFGHNTSIFAKKDAILPNRIKPLALSAKMKASLEHLDPQENSSFQIKEVVQNRFDAPYHYHPAFELTLIIAGNGKRFVGNHITDFHPGDLVLLGSNLPHCWQNHRQDWLVENDESPKTEQAAPAQQPMILNIDNSSKNSNSSNGGGTTIIHEKVVEKPAKEEKKKEEKSESSDAPW